MKIRNGKDRVWEQLPRSDAYGVTIEGIAQVMQVKPIWVAYQIGRLGIRVVHDGNPSFGERRFRRAKYSGQPRPVQILIRREISASGV